MRSWNQLTKAALILCAAMTQVWARDVKPLWFDLPMYSMGHNRPQCSASAHPDLADACRSEDETMRDFIDYLNEAIPHCHFSNPHLVGAYQRDFLLSERNPTGLLPASIAQQGDTGFVSFVGTRAVTFDCHCEGQRYPLERLRITKYRRFGCARGFVAKEGYNRHQVGLGESERDLGQPIQWPYLCTPASSSVP